MGGYTSQGWMGQTSGSLGGGRPLIQGPLISRQKRNQIKRGVNKFTGGVKDVFTKNPSNKYQSVPQSSVAPAAPEGASLEAQMPGVFESDATALQSDAMSGEIYGGSSAERAEAASLASGKPASASGKGGGGGMNADALSSGVSAAAGLGSMALDAIDDDPGYGGADAGKAALQGAAMGANPALVAATGGLSIVAGAVIGGTIGLIKKGKYEKEERKRKRKESKALQNKEDQKASIQASDSFYGGQSAANQAAYTGQDIDMFINKYAQ